MEREGGVGRGSGAERREQKKSVTGNQAGATAGEEKKTPVVTELKFYSNYSGIKSLPLTFTHTETR